MINTFILLVLLVIGFCSLICLLFISFLIWKNRNIINNEITYVRDNLIIDAEEFENAVFDESKGFGQNVIQDSKIQQVSELDKEFDEGFKNFNGGL